MGSEEIIVGYKESDESDRTIDTIKSMRRFHMVFKCSVESFDELLEWPVSL